MIAAALMSAATALAEEPKVAPPPADPAAAKAYAVLDGACAGCHQTGRLKALKQPAGSLGNILDVEALARTPSLIVPGNPDASPLYQMIHARTMPPEGSETATPELTAGDLGTLRDWIGQLPPATGCTGRTPLTPEMTAKALQEAASRLGPTRAPTIRFVSLAALHVSCADAATLDGARMAVTYLINALSLGLDPVKLAASGPSDLLLEIDLGAIGWSVERWDRLAYRAPAAGFVPVGGDLQKSYGTRLPLIEAGWFADAATRAPLYYDLIGMPETLNALLASLRIDLSNEKRDGLDRIGLKGSAVARGNRLIERRPFANGAAWFSREFAPTAGRPDLFDLTVAAAAPGAVANRIAGQPQPDTTLMHFDLPNGFPAFFMAAAGGQRSNDVPASVLKDDAHPGRKFAATQSCLGCHSALPVALPRGRADDLKARLQAETALSKEVRDKLLAPHSEPAEWQARLDADKSRFERAMAAAGLEPGRLVDGLDPLPALIARYQRAVTVGEIADLAGVPTKRILDAGRSGSANLADVTQRLAFGAVPRTAVDAVLPELARRLGFDAPGGTPSTAQAAVVGGAPELVLKADRPVFQAGDLLAVTVRSNFNCHLSLLILDSKGRATVLYPNEFDADPQLEAGKDVRLPPEKAPYQFRLREKGEETLIGVCATTRAIDGIRHDFEKQRFTELGDYRAFLNRTWPNKDGADGKPRPRAAARRPGETAEPAPVAAKAEPHVRASIRIQIE